jgi:hypothetical protein
MLNALQVKNAKSNGGKRARFGDGNNLWLFVDPRGNKSWVFRFKSPVTGTEREMGLGPERDLSLVEARQAAQEARKLLLTGQDPLEVRNSEKKAAKIDGERAITFQDYAERFIEMRESGWKNPIHRQQWRNSLRDHVFAKIGAMPIADVDTAAVRLCLDPIWNTLPETARRSRGRMEGTSGSDVAQAPQERRGASCRPALHRVAGVLAIAGERYQPRRTHVAVHYPDRGSLLGSRQHGTGRSQRQFVDGARKPNESRKGARRSVDHRCARLLAVYARERRHRGQRNPPAFGHASDVPRDAQHVPGLVRRQDELSARSGGSRACSCDRQRGRGELSARHCIGKTPRVDERMGDLLHWLTTI